MTGYGKGEVNYGDKVVTVEVRSLNGKIGDIRIKSPFNLGTKELDLRRIIQDGAIRGKLDVTIEIKGNVMLESGMPNADAIRGYFNALQQIAGDLSVSPDAIFQSVLRLPNIFQSVNGQMSDEDLSSIIAALQGALTNLTEFRMAEGEILRQDLRSRIMDILRLLELVDGDEPARQAAFRDRLAQKLSELKQEGFDENRLEQEILYYLDKLDINEEKVRLRQHCLYFLEQMDGDELVIGKKLNFISQEIGREMNTLGAKAQWTAIQHNVVEMKNALEEIKEQLANAL